MASLMQYRRRRAAGQCTECETPTDKALCPACAEIAKAKSRDRRERRKNSGKCVNCGVRSPRAGRVRCAVCAKSQQRNSNERRAAWREAGLCPTCTTPVETGVYCLGCKAKKVERYQRQKSQVFDHYGRKCVCCGETREYFLQIDHVNDDGYLHRKEIGPTNLYRWAIQNGFPDTLQTLCANCNFGKKMNDGVCPCQSDSEIN